MDAPTSDNTVRILVVDDNIDHAQLAMRALRAEPAWRVDTVRLGSEALDKLGDQPYDLLLLDYRLPDMTGLEVLQRVRKDHADVAVLLMTSQGSEEVAIEALNAGASGYVVKGAEFGKRLAYEVREWLAERDERREG